jgi:hypothetical protein
MMISPKLNKMAVELCEDYVLYSGFSVLRSVEIIEVVVDVDLDVFAEGFCGLCWGFGYFSYCPVDFDSGYGTACAGYKKYACDHIADKLRHRSDKHASTNQKQPQNKDTGSDVFGCPRNSICIKAKNHIKLKIDSTFFCFWIPAFAGMTIFY